MPAKAPQKPGRVAIATALVLSAMWGLNIVGIKVALATFPPAWNAFWRALLGWPVLWVWARQGGVRLKPLPGETRPLVQLGVFFAIQIIMLNLSLDWTSAGFASVLLNAAPVFINTFAHFYVPGDHLSGQRLAGLAMAFGGVAILFLGQPDPSLAPRPVLGNALAFVTAAVIGGRMVYTQRLVQHMDSMRVIFWQVGFSLPVFLLFAAIFEPLMVGPLTLWPFVSWMYCSLGVVGIAFVLWIRLLEKNSPALLSVFVFPTPIFGVAFSALIYSEALPVELVIGVLCVAFGILIVMLEKRRQAIEPFPERTAGTPRAERSESEREPQYRGEPETVGVSRAGD
ncbi:MAG: DMT family transporter [Bryobacterales bacterium]|nr:DMT family transporter [Bryobacterales bacterium]